MAKKSKSNDSLIPQHKRMAMGLPIPQGPARDVKNAKVHVANRKRGGRGR